MGGGKYGVSGLRLAFSGPRPGWRIDLPVTVYLCPSKKPAMQWPELKYRTFHPWSGAFHSKSSGHGVSDSHLVSWDLGTWERVSSPRRALWGHV